MVTKGPTYLRVLIVACALLYFLYCPVCITKQTRHQKSPPEFASHEIIHVNLFSRNNRSLSFADIQHIPCKSLSIIELRNENITLRVIVFSNDKLTPDHYFEKLQENGRHLVRKKRDIEGPNYCHYQGFIEKQPNSIIALSIFENSLTGIIGDSNETYHVHYDESSMNHLLLKTSHLKSGKHLKCGVNNRDINPSIQAHDRPERSIGVDHPYPHRPNKTSRYVELILVNDYAEFVNHSKSRKDLVFRKSQQIANIVNALYSQLNIFVALVGVIIWSEKDEMVISDDGDVVLTNFLRYRQTRLLPDHPNDNSQLITGRVFKAGVVGKALKGPICTYEFSGGVNTDHSDVTSLVATTVAHELGHNFGMEHDTSSCFCGPGEKCIMSDSSGSISPRKWSNCSVEYLNHALGHGMDHCLMNEPLTLVGPVCGNGFTEKGEECDCGLKDYCNNPCCDASSCKLMPGAQCAIGPCCNLDTCSLTDKEHRLMCREARSECDLSEICDGTSEFCPEDLFVQDGTACGNPEAFCYQGMCSSHDSQCKLLWGATGRQSPEVCFRENMNGRAAGNCGLHRTNKTYVACSKEDIYCGLLHCDHLNEKLEFGMESAAEMHKLHVPQIGKTIICSTTLIDLGLDVRDPGLVPNGAKCGLNMMCLNQKCVPVATLKAQNPCPNDCSGNGFCDNKGLCHCLDGYALPDCEQPLPRLYHLTLALYIIFLCILPLTAFAAFIVYYFHSNIKTWWVLRARTAAIKARAKKANAKNRQVNTRLNLKSLHISNPMPLDGTDAWSTNNFNENSAFCRPAQFSQNEPSPVQFSHIVPSRPAPPPPVFSSSSTPISPKQNEPKKVYSRENRNNFSRNASMRSSVRPKHPPPKPPPLVKDIDASSSSESPDDSSTVPLTTSKKLQCSTGSTNSEGDEALKGRSDNVSLVKSIARQLEKEKFGSR